MNGTETLTVEGAPPKTNPFEGQPEIRREPEAEQLRVGQFAEAPGYLPEAREEEPFWNPELAKTHEIQNYYEIMGDESRNNSLTHQVGGTIVLDAEGGKEVELQGDPNLRRQFFETEGGYKRMKAFLGGRREERAKKAQADP